jgi:hypothetical protein
MAEPKKFIRFKDALRHALSTYESPSGRRGKNISRGEVLHKLATDLIDMAVNSHGNQKLLLIKELVDRLDGKATQAISGVEGEPITVVQRVIVQQPAREREREIDITPKPPPLDIKH